MTFDGFERRALLNSSKCLQRETKEFPFSWLTIVWNWEQDFQNSEENDIFKTTHQLRNSIEVWKCRKSTNGKLLQANKTSHSQITYVRHFSTKKKRLLISVFIYNEVSLENNVTKKKKTNNNNKRLFHLISFFVRKRWWKSGMHFFWHSSKQVPLNLYFKSIASETLL